jgi:hypothetical protein
VDGIDKDVGMTQRTLLSRLLSPAGFGLTLLLFLLPFVALSCDTAEGPVHATFTGVDMLVGGEPDITGPLPLSPEDEEVLFSLINVEVDTEPWAVIAVIVIFAGMVWAVIRERLARHAGGTGLAVLAVAALVAAELSSISKLDEVRDTKLADLAGSEVAGSSQPRIGFWLVVATLGALAVGNAIALARAWRDPGRGGGSAGRAGPIAAANASSNAAVWSARPAQDGPHVEPTGPDEPDEPPARPD